MFDYLLWTKLNTFTPQTLHGHTLVHYNNALYLFGGAKDASLSNDLYKFSQRKWEKIVASNPPSRRYGHTAVVKDDNMFVFGGEDDGSEEEVNEVHRFDFKRQKWTKLLIKSEYVPVGRDGHSAVVYGDEMIVFGGYNSEWGELSNVESLDLKKHTWAHVKEFHQGVDIIILRVFMNRKCIFLEDLQRGN
jgi:N-acetylneuraminic acid mutarotase